MKRMLVAALFTLFTIYTASGQTNGDEYLDKCNILSKGASPDRCKCIIDVSNSLTDNNPILDIYFKSLYKESIQKAYAALIESKTYDRLNFSSPKEKEEFIQGKSRLFLHRIDKECGI